MTTDQKIAYLRDFMKLISNSTTYRDALSHSNYIRGMAGAWRADNTLSVDNYNRIIEDIDVMMEVKRNLPMQGDVV